MKYSPCFIALVFCFVWNAPLSAQTLDSAKADTVPKARENWYWAHLELGPGFGFNQNGFNVTLLQAGLGGSVAFSHHLITLEGNIVLTGLVNGFLWAGGMYGYIARNDWTFSSVSAGLAWVGNGRDAGVGLLLEGQIAAKVPVLGVGLKLLANINAIYPYGALSVIVPLGWMP